MSRDLVVAWAKMREVEKAPEATLDRGEHLFAMVRG